MRNPTKQPAKNVQSRRLCVGRIGTEVREQMQDRGLGGSRGNLLQVEWSLGGLQQPNLFLMQSLRQQGKKG
jgi:hypothetical protein